MNEKHLRKLEFDKVLDLLASHASSAYAKEKCLKLRPSDNIFEIDRRQAETEEGFRYVRVKGVPSFGRFMDIRPSVRRTALGGSLTMQELLDVADTLHAVEHIKDFGKRDSSILGDFPNLDPMFDGLIPVRDLEREINRCILTPDEMSDDASAKLHKIRKEIVIQENRIQSQLQSMVHSDNYRSMLQDQIITLRQGRYCLPVKSEFRTGIQGMVHDQSSSGSTLFVEPMAVVQMNNTIAALRVDEQEEIIRILAELSSRVHDKAESIMADFELLGELDLIFARAALARDMDAVRPKLNEKGYINLPGARHPLLDAKKVVPIDIYLGDTFRSLVITGPNTGGKTVTLKTLGLLQVMGQAGLHLPAGDKAEITVLDNVFTDIGDEQSIEQSLSTFSSHMVNIVEILKEVTPWSLALFDELGAGTDPVEGAALAQSIIEHLRKRQVLTAATTHYSELKIYALSQEGVENASCEFNVETLMPTYRLLIGIPGKSNAFAISRRLGIPEEIIEDAGALLESNDVEFEDMLSDLEKRRSEIEHEKSEISRLKRELSSLNMTAAEEKDKLAKQKEKIMEKAREEAKEIVRKAKAEADATISRMNKIIQKGGNYDMSSLEKERSSLRQKLNKLEEKEEAKTQVKGKKVTLEELLPGTEVMVKGFDGPVSIIRKPDAKGKLEVQAGILKMQVKVDDILSILEDEVSVPKAKTSKERTRSSEDITKSASFHPEIDLRGMLTDEGIDELDMYLDDAFLSGMEQVRVIHGKGTGAMRKAVHNYLRKSPHVKSFRLGVYGEGDSGVTVVELKK